MCVRAAGAILTVGGRQVRGRRAYARAQHHGDATLTVQTRASRSERRKRLSARRGARHATPPPSRTAPRTNLYNRRIKIELFCTNPFVFSGVCEFFSCIMFPFT